MWKQILTLPAVPLFKKTRKHEIPTKDIVFAKSSNYK